MKAKGHVFKYGDNVVYRHNYPARYLNATEGAELARHCMEDIDKEFVNQVQPGISLWPIKILAADPPESTRR